MYIVFFLFGKFAEQDLCTCLWYAIESCERCYLKCYLKKKNRGSSKIKRNAVSFVFFRMKRCFVCFFSNEMMFRLIFTELLPMLPLLPQNFILPFMWILYYFVIKWLVLVICKIRFIYYILYSYTELELEVAEVAQVANNKKVS